MIANHGAESCGKVFSSNDSLGVSKSSLTFQRPEIEQSLESARARCTHGAQWGLWQEQE